MSKIAVFGDKESVYGFGALGMDTYYLGAEDPAPVFRKLCQSEGYGIIYITEAAASMLSKEIEKYKDAVSPAIILIPGVRGNTGEGLSALRASVERAVGSDIFGE